MSSVQNNAGILTPLERDMDMPSEFPAANGIVWFLSGQFSQASTLRHIPLHSFPFRIGRRTDLSLCLPTPTVSTVHAELLARGDELILRDLNSTNGTYVNGRRIHGEERLKAEDLLHFADLPFRLMQHEADTSSRTQAEDVCDKALALVQFDTLMAERAVVPYFQPIVRIDTLVDIGYEVLGRSRMVGLQTPAAMFRAAAQLNLEVELSRMIRWEAIQISAALPRLPHLFVNTHAEELVRPGLQDSMRACREMHPEQPITLEIHEAAVTSPREMAELRAALNDIQIGLAYDDFGAGQTRLSELVEVPPDYLKFDMSLIRDIHQATSMRQQVLSTLVRMARELGIVTLAEGIENEGEARVCRELGFELAQGFFYGHPAPITGCMPNDASQVR
jgi:EAL domain-containing protein (putative c-di-GMP-specific phosphodiesterase class I)